MSADKSKTKSQMQSEKGRANLGVWQSGCGKVRIRGMNFYIIRFEGSFRNGTSI